jgi:hypothetical protein
MINKTEMILLTVEQIERHRNELITLRGRLGERANQYDIRIALCDLALIGRQALDAEVVGIAGKRYDGVYNLPVGTELIVKPNI